MGLDTCSRRNLPVEDTLPASLQNVWHKRYVAVLQLRDILFFSAEDVREVPFKTSIESALQQTKMQEQNSAKRTLRPDITRADAQIT